MTNFNHIVCILLEPTQIYRYLQTRHKFMVSTLSLRAIMALQQLYVPVQLSMVIKVQSLNIFYRLVLNEF